MVVVVGGKYSTTCTKGGGIVRAGEMSGGGICPRGDIFPARTDAHLAHGGGGRGDVLHHVTMGGELSGRGNVRGRYVRGENVRIPMKLGVCILSVVGQNCLEAEF